MAGLQKTALAQHNARIDQVAEMVLQTREDKPLHLQDYLRFQALDPTHA